MYLKNNGIPLLSKLGISIANNKYLLFALFWLLVISLYAPAYRGGFYEDFCEFAEKYRKIPFSDFLNLTPSSLYQGVNLFHYVFLHLFGLSPLPWFLLFTFLHAWNGILVFCFFSRLFIRLGVDRGRFIALAGVFVWLLSPVVCEVVVWKATSHYLTSTALIFAILNLLFAWLDNNKPGYLAGMWLLYALSTVFLELFYLTPVFVLCILVALYAAKSIHKKEMVRSLTRVFIPLIIIWCAYYFTFTFVTNKATARADFDIRQLFLPEFVLGKFTGYTLYILGMEFMLPHDFRKAIHRFADHTWTHIFVGCVLAGILLSGIIRFRHGTAGMRALFTLFVLTGVSCVIILPMWFYDTFPYQGSRYYYLPGIFFYMLFVFFIVKIFSAKAPGFYIVLLYAIACTAVTSILTRNVRGASAVFYGILKNFRWQDEEKVFLLNLPTLQNGVGVIGAGEPSNFAYHFHIFCNDTLRARVYDVSSYNMTGMWDGAHVTVMDSVTLKVTPNQYGSWWWYEGFGASDYENEEYRVSFTDNGFSYILQFKKRLSPGSVVLYQVGEGWKEVNMNLLHQEQW